MPDTDKKTFEQWAVLELFGHGQIAGLVSEQAIGGQGFIRVDVPPTPLMTPFTKFFNPSAVYAITPCSEQAARTAADKMNTRPVTVWTVPDRTPIPAQVEDPLDDVDF